MARIAINGFGRIGRTVLKVGWDNPAFEVVAINDLTDATTLAYLLKHDTNYGVWNVDVHAEGDVLVIGGKRIALFAEKDPSTKKLILLSSLLDCSRPKKKPWRILLQAHGVLCFRHQQKAVTCQHL